LQKASEIKDHLRCALCREVCLNTDSYLVSARARNKPAPGASILSVKPPKKMTNTKRESSLMEKEEEFSDIKIVGSYNSAKVEGVVKCLVKILSLGGNAKCIVFSEHFVILDLIISLLYENSISYRSIRGPSGTSTQRSIDSFKSDPSVNVLLMLYSHGALGLNLTEATHVLLVEPTLDKSQEIQAIGRVHRIGQTKPTFVHRFIIRDTIEEQVYKMFNSSKTQVNSTKATTSKSAANNAYFSDNDNENVFLTVGDIHSLYRNL
jgi:E3 ubiquitin-protein ligase SHPRH